MAKLANTPFPGDWEIDYDKPIDDEFKRTDKMLQALMDNQPTPDSKTLVGAVLMFPVADGKAIYVVTRDSPLTIAWIPYGDAWQVDACMVRGINKDDVRQHLKRHAMCKELFGGPSNGKTMDNAGKSKAVKKPVTKKEKPGPRYHEVTVTRIEYRSHTFRVFEQDQDTAERVAFAAAPDYDYNTCSVGNVEYEIACTRSEPFDNLVLKNRGK